MYVCPSTSLSLSLSLSDTQIKQPDQQATGIRFPLDTPGNVNGRATFLYHLHLSESSTFPGHIGTALVMARWANLGVHLDIRVSSSLRDVLLVRRSDRREAQVLLSWVQRQHAVRVVGRPFGIVGDSLCSNGRRRWSGSGERPWSALDGVTRIYFRVQKKF